MGLTEQGWKADPTGRHELRYHDGRDWTARVRDGTTHANDALEPGAIAQPATRRDERATLHWGIFWALVLPIVGVVVAIVLFSRDQIGQGLAVLTCCGLSAIVYLALLASS